MGIFANNKIRKAINAILSVPDVDAPETADAVAKLKAAGSAAIPKLLATLDSSPTPDIITELLISCVSDDTLPIYIKELASTNYQMVAGVTNILSAARTYNPHELIEYFAYAKFSKASLTQILTCHKDKLGATAIADLLGIIDKENRTSILQLVDEAATEVMIPLLLPLTETEDWITRLSIVRILSRFNAPQVQDTLLHLLSDPHKSIRQTVLEGLANMKNPDHIGPICQLLSDPDLTVQSKAIEAVIQINHPQTVQYLLELLQDESEYVRRGAVEVLNVIGNKGAIKDLLEAIRDKDWWVRVRAADALGTIGGPAVVDAVLDLIQDEDEFIRRCAIEILNTTKDERAFTYLIDALGDDDWWVRERAVDALAELGDARAVPALLPILGKDVETSRVVLRALATLGDPSAVPQIVTILQSPDRSVIKEALQALGTLTNAQYATMVQEALVGMARTSDASIRGLADSTLQALIGKFGDQTNATQIISAPSTSAGSQYIPAQPDVGMSSLLAPSAELPQDLTVPSMPVGIPESIAIFNPEALKPDAVLVDRYRVIRQVGKGGFGIVVLVEDTVVNEQIVLKFLNPHLAATEQIIKRFIHELRYSRKVTHENVIRIYDFLTFGKSYAISMEYFSSHPLSDYIKPDAELTPQQILKIIQDICSGMSAAHQVQVVHRDLKPANILLDDKMMLKIVDFGLSAAVDAPDSRVTKTGFMVGTPTYMSPEQVRGETIDARTDIYSLGIIMYEFFTGKPPYAGKDAVSIIYQHVEGKAKPPRELNEAISPELESVILKAMAAAPEERYQSMDALHEAIAGLEER